MRVLILGGDGYLGWPTAMHLSACGHDVAVVDNYFRRDALERMGLPPLFPVARLDARVRLWQQRSGTTIEAHIGDATDYGFLKDVVGRFLPDTIVHYAEQPSAPYSMLDRDSAVFTLTNNLVSTANIVHAVKEVVPDCHVVKLGTMGEYGTPNIDIEEGFIDIEHKGRRDRLLFPRQAGSLYHTTKIQDTDLLWFYVRAWGLRVTDLMQGPVYGIYTGEMAGDTALASHFNYDEIFGTVLNRFVVQAVAGVPLTVYGKGGQTRGYLDIRDTMQCLRLAIEHPAKAGELRVFNQFTETFTVNELAERIQDAARSLQIDVAVDHVANPRIEAESHYYNPAHSGLRDLGLEPHLLSAETLGGMLETAARHAADIRHDSIQPRTTWQR